MSTPLTRPMCGSKTIQIGVIIKELPDGAGKSLAMHTFNILSIYCFLGVASVFTLLEAGACDR